MILAKEQRIGGMLLFGLALIAWIVYAAWPSRQPLPPNKPTKKPWSERKDSIRRADSLRFIQWKEERQARYDSFFLADSLRHEAWKIERQARWDSMRRADSLWRDSVGWKYAKRIKKDTVLDLNHCDTTELQLIRGIGPFVARRIVRYRDQLGGFYSTDQLTDEPLADYRLDTLLGSFTASPNDVRLVYINSCSAEVLSRHPYLRYDQAKAIYNLRRQHLRLRSVDDLRTLPDLPDSTLLRLAPYLSFE
jgi:DNA uptake protein ComE-like DNA-binding protein